MSKWQLLRSALLGGKRDHSNKVSIHSFRGFTDLIETQLLHKKEVTNVDYNSKIFKPSIDR